MRRIVILSAVVFGLAACKKEDKAAPAPAAAPGAPIVPGAPPPGALGADTAAAAARLAEQAAGVANNAAAAAAYGAAAAAVIPRPATVTDAHVAAAEAMFGAFERAGLALTAAGQDCGKATAALKAAQPAFLAAQTKLGALKGSLDDDDTADDWILATYGLRMQAALGPFMAAAMTCESHAGFQAALDKFDLDADSADEAGRRADEAGRAADDMGRALDKLGE